MNHSSKNILPSIFSPRGRIGRLSFLAWNAILFFSFMGLLQISQLYFNNGGENISNKSTAFILLSTFIIACIFFVVLNIIFMIKRLHDRNHTGWLVLINLIPLMNIIFTFYLLLASGSAKRNEYGLVRNTPAWEKIVAFLSIILAVFIIIFYPDFFQILKM